MKPDGARAVEREAAEQDDAGYGVGGLGEAGAGEIVMHKALGEKPAEQSLYEPVLEVELHCGVVDAGRGREHHRPDRFFLSPAEVAGARLGGLAEGIERVGPRGVAAEAGVDVGQPKTVGGAGGGVGGRRGGHERFRAAHLQRA